MTKQNKWLGPFHFNGSCITSQLLHLDIKLMLHFWDKSTTFKVYFSKKLVKKTKNWMNLQIKRYSISSRLLTDFPPFPILPSTTKVFDLRCFHSCSTFWSFYNPAENDESFTQNDFQEFYYFYICFYRAVNFFFCGI